MKKRDKVDEEPEVTPEEIDELVKLYKKAVKAKKLLEERLAKEKEEANPSSDLSTGEFFVLFKLSALDSKLSALDSKLSYLLGIAGIVGALVIAVLVAVL